MRSESFRRRILLCVKYSINKAIYIYLLNFAVEATKRDNEVFRKSAESDPFLSPVTSAVVYRRKSDQRGKIATATK
jgi:hypothetical protein